MTTLAEIKIEPVPWPQIAAVICIVGVFGLATGFTYPAISFLMEANDVAPSIIGGHAAMAGFGVLVASLLLPRLAMRIGPWPVAMASLLTAVAMVAMPGYFTSVPIIYLSRFFMGAAVSGLFIMSETWLNEFTPDHARGKVVSIYTATIALTFGTGPVLIPQIGYQGWFPYTVMAMVMLTVGAPLLALRGKVRSPEWISYREMGRTLLMIPIVLLAVMSFGILDGITLSLWPTFAALKGSDESWAAYTLFAFIAGNAVIQPLVGWAADRFGRRLLMRICALGGCLGAVGMALIDLNSIWVIPLGVAWGGLAFGVYTVSLVFIGMYLRGGHLIAANAAFGVVWGFGSMVGGPTSGRMIELAGPNGMPLSVAVVFLVLTVLVFAVDPVGNVRKDM